MALISPTSLTGLLCAAMAMSGYVSDNNDDNNALAVIGMLILVCDAAVIDPAKEGDDEPNDPRRGPYGIVKSNTLSVMMCHTDDMWHRQFFWFVRRRLR